MEALRCGLPVLVGCIWALSACSSGADLLATEQASTRADAGGEDPFFFDVDVIQSCEPGLYQGSFTGTLGLPPSPGEIKGYIEFELVPTLVQEFYLIRDSTLEGASDNGVAIHADVQGTPGGVCREGQFDSTLENGVFGDAENGFPFRGIVTGTYDAEQLSFRGNWETFVDGFEGDIARGRWMAVHVDRY
jgi:hypothetical protein